jgi:hypothetical protein
VAGSALVVGEDAGRELVLAGMVSQKQAPPRRSERLQPVLPKWAAISPRAMARPRPDP